VKILFLHGWQSTPGGLKPTYLKDHGHEVLNPALPNDDFEGAVRIAQAEYDQHKPDVVVGSGRGGAVAMNIGVGTLPMVLLCPAWKRWGAATSVQANTVILQSRCDEVVPFADSEELVKNSGLSEAALIVVGKDHRLADANSLAVMLKATEEAIRPQVAHEVWKFILVAVIDDIPVVRFADFNLAMDRHEAGEVSRELFSLVEHTKSQTIILDFEEKPIRFGAYFHGQLALLNHRLNGRLMLCNAQPDVVTLIELTFRGRLRVFSTLDGALLTAKS
jgi:predicted esterase YcpF (UPF0227 family)